MDGPSMEVYEPIEEVQSIATALVENIYNDSSYQEYLKDLKESDTTVSNKKLDVISKTFTDIKVFNTNKNPLFLVNDIGVILGATTINTMIKNYTNTEKTTGMVLINNKLVKKVFLTKHGVYRIMFNNKSKLSDVFRAYICKLLDHMEINGKDLTQELMNEITSENPELINDAMNEYNNNLAKYKSMYELERTQKKILELTIENNYILYKDIENEKIQIEIKQNYNDMYIKQLHNEREMALEKLYLIKDDVNSDDTVMALDFMKKKYLKEFTISIVHPNTMNKVFSSKKFPLESNEEYIAHDIINDSDFKFLLQVFNTTGRINEEEMFYFTLAFKSVEKHVDKDTAQKDVASETYITSDYISDKIKFLELLELLKNDVDHFHIPGSKKMHNNYIYHTSLENIKLTTKSLIICN